jgi:hypothetical protein
LINHPLTVLDTTTDTAADKATTGASPTTDQKATKTESQTDATNTGTKTDKNTAKETGTQTGTQTGKPTGKSTKSGNSTSTSIDPRDPVGGISMLTPSAGATTYYKIGDLVTFEWKYTSLSVTPSAVNVVASCSKNSETYTISGNMSVSETSKVVWDTKKYQSNATVPLLTATYTLYVYDTNATLGDTASAGHLGSQIGYNFGMYTPQSYTGLNGMFRIPLTSGDPFSPYTNVAQEAIFVLLATAPSAAQNAMRSNSQSVWPL